ncbi:MAG TPA: FlgD immunoglobulin-like domain containing protein, partial [Candidatus Udaeobacter sp.]|nr:FlgD immunoglobulin-like domain containing protein [Candidatus Udaeobacter sp.]
PSLIGVSDGGAPSIGRVGLSAFPSPAAGPMGITVDVPRAGRVEVGVYDVAGRLVQTLLAGPLPAGAHRLTWDGAGAASGSGVYFIRLRSGSEQAVEKVVRVR